MEVKARTLDGTFTESFLLVLPQGERSCFQFRVWKISGCFFLQRQRIYLLFLCGSRERLDFLETCSLSVDGKWQLHYFFEDICMPDPSAAPLEHLHEFSFASCQQQLFDVRHTQML